MRRSLILIGLLVAAFATGGVLTGDAEADTPVVVDVVLPSSLAVTPGETHLLFRGPPSTSTTSSVACQAGTFPVQEALATHFDSARFWGQPTTTDVVVLHDHPLPLGSRYLIAGAAGPCGLGFTRYSVVLSSGGPTT